MDVCVLKIFIVIILPLSFYVVKKIVNTVSQFPQSRIQVFSAIILPFRKKCKLLTECIFLENLKP